MVTCLGEGLSRERKSDHVRERGQMTGERSLIWEEVGFR